MYSVATGGISCSVGPVQSLPQRVTRHEQWNSFIQSHCLHWHGLWTTWYPMESQELSKSYKTLRSMRLSNPEKTKVHHMNRWYDSSPEGKELNRSLGPWEIIEDEHNTADGIIHPNSASHRMLVHPSGDLAWATHALKADGPLFFTEMFCIMSPQKNRFAVSAVFEAEGRFKLSVCMEEVRDTDEKPDATWQPKFHSSQLSLESSRVEPDGTFFGEEQILTGSMLRSTQEVIWRGFKGGLSDENHCLIHFPYGISVFCPTENPIGKSFGVNVTWIASAKEVRVISEEYAADGSLECFKSGKFFLTE